MRIQTVLLSVCVALAPLGAAAEEILLRDAVRQSQAEAIELPARGATMAEVEARFGAPVRRGATVGDPPITPWVYDRFTVYFEGDRVIHAVVHRPQAPLPAQP